VIAALLAPLALASACSEDEPPSVVVPSSAFGETGETGTTGATGGVPTGETGEPPIEIPPTGATGGNVEAGQAALSVTGDIQASKAVGNLVSSVYAPPPGGMALVWTAGGTDATTIGLGGLSFTGSQRTSPTLSLTLTVQTDDGIANFQSMNGECSITIGAAGANQVSGTFTCTDLQGDGGQVIDATGSFNAQG
jgi:collagen type I alpha